MSHAHCDHAHLVCNVVWTGPSTDPAAIRRHAEIMREALELWDAEYPPKQVTA